MQRDPASAYDADTARILEIEREIDALQAEQRDCRRRIMRYRANAINEVATEAERFQAVPLPFLGHLGLPEDELRKVIDQQDSGYLPTVPLPPE